MDIGADAKKESEATICGAPVGSGNMPMPLSSHDPKIIIGAPIRPDGNVMLILRPRAKTRARIPLIMIPKFRIVAVIAVLGSGLVGKSEDTCVPARSLNQFSVQLKFGE